MRSLLTSDNTAVTAYMMIIAMDSLYNVFVTFIKAISRGANKIENSLTFNAK